MSDFEYRTDDNEQEKQNQSEPQSDYTVLNENSQGSTGGDSTYHYSGDPYRETYRDSDSESYQNSYQNGRDQRYHYTGNQNESYRQNNQAPKRRRGGDGNMKKWGMNILKIAGAALIFGVVAGAAFYGVSAINDHVTSSSKERIETTTSDSDGKSNSGTAAGAVTAQDVSAVVDKVMPSVVSITGTFQTSGFYGFQSQESEGAGSGFIIADDGDKLMIATNNHVVADSTSLTVGFNDGSTADAKVVGTDSNADLAVISVEKKNLEGKTMSAIKVATLGSSDDLKVGEAVIAIGNALGYGQSVTTGVVSAKDREVSFADGTMTLLQTDAAINPGNSGGVLINLKGEVVGINNAKLEDTSVEGMGYAIPITTANTVLNDLMNADSISEKDASYLGIVGKTIDSTYSDALGMPSGIYVSQVVKDSPAEEAGIAAGDVITEFEGNNVSSMNGLKEKISVKKAGTKVKITLQRANQNGEYEEKEIEVTLGKASDYKDATENIEEQEQEQNNNSGNYNGNGDNSNGYYYNNGNGNGNGGYYDPFYYFFN